MNKYEAMLIVKPDLSDEDKKALFKQVDEAVTKNGGQIPSRVSGPKGASCTSRSRNSRKGFITCWLSARLRRRSKNCAISIS
jgi:hypothetical protein